jgi:hypothetical protein
MTLKIERAPQGKLTILKLIGQIGISDLEELKIQMEDAGSDIQFDLDDLTLIDVGVVRFLSQCEDSGVELQNCPLYVREWIKRERNKK